MLRHSLGHRRRPPDGTGDKTAFDGTAGISVASGLPEALNFAGRSAGYADARPLGGNTVHQAQLRLLLSCINKFAPAFAATPNARMRFARPELVPVILDVPNRANIGRPRFSHHALYEDAVTDRTTEPERKQMRLRRDDVRSSRWHELMTPVDPDAMFMSAEPAQRLLVVLAARPRRKRRARFHLVSSVRCADGDFERRTEYGFRRRHCLFRARCSRARLTSNRGRPDHSSTSRRPTLSAHRLPVIIPESVA